MIRIIRILTLSPIYSVEILEGHIDFKKATKGSHSGLHKLKVDQFVAKDQIFS